MTRFANRKSRIRAFQAAHPGMGYGVAARHVDTANTADLLANLRHTPMVALAAALNTAGELTFAAELARTIAAEQRPDPEAERLARAAGDAYDAMFNAPAGLSAAAHAALAQAYNDADNEQYYHSAADPYDGERAVVGAAFTALSVAATLADGAPVLARAAADVLATLAFEFTADAIRCGEKFGPVPRAADNPAARFARAAVEALAAASEVRFGGDEEWGKCMGLLNQALQLANDAAAVDLSDASST